MRRWIFTAGVLGIVLSQAWLAARVSTRASGEGFSPPVSGTFLAVDCDVSVPGIQSSCSAAGGEIYAVDLVFGNVDVDYSGGPIDVAAFWVTVSGDNQHVFNPPQTAASFPWTDANPDFDEQSTGQLGDWRCAPPIPAADSDPDPARTRSTLYCYVPDVGTAVPIGTTITLARLHLLVSTSGAGVFSVDEFFVGDINGNEIGNCVFPGGILTTCFGATVDYERCPDRDCDDIPDNFDNCPAAQNQTQANADRNTIVLTPDRAFDDATRANSDALGDACDSDDDNDGLSDADEASGAACGGVATDPLLADSDGDRIIDSAECALAPAEHPMIAHAGSPPAACVVPGDSDGDAISDAREFCYYGTNPANINTDGDNCSDRREVMSINADFAVNAIDLGQVAQAFGAYPLGAPAYKANFDVTKNGVIDAIDLGQVAQAFGYCP